MKYRDILTLFLVIILILSLAFTIGVNSIYWFVPAIIFLIFLYLSYKLYIEK